MEIEPGGPSLKRVKLAAVDCREESQAPMPASPATEAAVPDPTATERTAQPPPVDRISNLPDPILGEIVSLLRTKQGARTQVLSTRWRHIWRAAPLNLDRRAPPPRRRRRDKLGRFVSRVISTHPGPGRRFRARPRLLPPGPGRLATLPRPPRAAGARLLPCLQLPAADSASVGAAAGLRVPVLDDPPCCHHRKMSSPGQRRPGASPPAA
jgi:hypothetical protein